MNAPEIGSGRVEVILLGTAQDGGLPQAGCFCRNCSLAYESPEMQRQPASLGIIDRSVQRFWMVDATPSFPAQLRALQLACPEGLFSGIFLTHAHTGHYTGLIHLGKEVLDLKGLPLFATDRMLGFLGANQPWKTLLRDNFTPTSIFPEKIIQLTDMLRLQPVLVPHRGEFSDTVGFWIETDSTSLFYCPDIDSWSGFPVEDILDRADHAFLDGTFNSPEDLPGRDLTQIPHPFVTETIRLAEGRRANVWLTHLNHSTPLAWPGPEQEKVARSGVRIASDGQRVVLG